MSTPRQATLVLLRTVCVVTTVLVSSSAVQAATASWDRNSEPNIAGYKLSYGTQPGVHTVTIDVGNVITYAFFPPAGKRYYVVVQAYTTTGELGPKSAEVTLDVPSANKAPILMQPANQTTPVDGTVSMALLAGDADGAALQFTAIGLPPGLAINNASGVIAGLTLSKGSYAVTVSASDGSVVTSRMFTWTVIANPAKVVDLSPLDTTLVLGTENYSAADWLYTYTWPANRVAMAILMKFNLAQIPANATVHSAVVNLFLTGADGNADEPNYTISLHQIVNRNPDIALATGYVPNAFSMWTANQCCLYQAPMAQADISAARSLTAVDQTAGFKTWDASGAVRAWLAAPASNYGLLINADKTKEFGSRVFASMQDAVAARRPFLRVTYTVRAVGMSAAPIQNPYVRVDGDFDGDRNPDLSTYQPSSGEWRIWPSTSNFAAPISAQWGAPDDVPVPADYDGDTRTDIAIYRPNTGNWHIWFSGSGQPLVVHWGGSAHTPVTLDHDGDGKADLALIGLSGGAILLSSSNYSKSVQVY
jgi:hypothetical protein